MIREIPVPPVRPLRRRLGLGLLALLVLSGLALRAYRLDELVTFLGDQGRDVTAVWRMVETGAPALLGPGSAFGMFQRGPLYYYFLLAGLAAAGGDPSGAALSIVVLDAAATLLMFAAGHRIGGLAGGLLSAALYATSGAAVILSRSFSNPAVLPFLSLLLWLALRQVVRGDDRFVAVAATAGAIAWQVHDQALLLVLWATGVLILLRPHISRRALAIAALAVLVLIAPFLLYEAQHDFLNLRAMFTYVATAAVRNAQGNVLDAARVRLYTTWDIVQAFLPLDGAAHTALVTAALAGIGVLLADLSRARTRERQLLALYSALPLLYVIWPGPVYASNLEIVLPVPFLVLAYGAARGFHWSRSGRRAPAAIALGLVSLVICSASSLQIFMSLHSASPGVNTLYAVRHAADTIIAQAAHRPFVLLLDTSKTNTEAYDTPYTYLLKWRGAQLAATAEAETFAVFDPAERARGQMNAGQVVAGIRVVHLLPPRAIGENLLQGADLTGPDDVSQWSLRAPPGATIFWDVKESALALRGDGSADAIFAVQRVELSPGAHYVVAFEYHNLLSRGTQRAYLLCLDQQGGFLSALPTRDGYAVGAGTVWQHGSFLVSTPSDCVRGRLWLRQEGSGSSWFRRVTLRRAQLDMAP